MLMLTFTAPAHSYVYSRPPTVAQQFSSQPAPAGNLQSARGERNLQDANEVKAARKAMIERRCQQMNPPIPPNILRHMDAFKAALLISRPMDDDAWVVLEPRLVAQLPAAQQAEADHVSRKASVPKIMDRRLAEVNSKESKEIMDREWDESQRPTRDRLSAIADDFINHSWNGGKAVTYDTSTKFAADVLIHVRRAFYAGSASEHVGFGQVPTTDNVPNPNRPKLVLDHMKWVYDNKTKSLTEQFRKEIFLCHGSGCEGNTKFYGFEGVIQHFGAKHTNAFSVGNVVVAWREAEWPEDPPFHPDPLSVKHAYQSTSSAATHSAYSACYGGYTRAGTSTPHMQPHLPQASPGPYQYGGHYAGPFAPPQMTTAAMPGYEYGQSYGTPMDSYQYQNMVPLGYGTHPGNGFMTSPAMANSAIAPPPAGPSQMPGMSDTLHKPDEANHRTSLFDKQVSTVIQIAQDMWKHTSGIKDLPNSVRMYVLLQRVVSKFYFEFNHEPSLNHFIDAFSNHEIPRALKSAPGLSCKVCQDELSLQPPHEERRTYTVLNLFQHFRSHHSGSQVSTYRSRSSSISLDWKENMIELPSDRVISGLIYTPGMDDDKLHTIATVFPKLFPTPLPKIGKSDAAEVNSPARSLPQDPKEAANHRVSSGTSLERSGPPSLGSPYTGSPMPPRGTEGEYDPLRPALAQTSHADEANGRRIAYRRSPPSEYTRRYDGDARHHVGQLQYFIYKGWRADVCSHQQPMDSDRADYDRRGFSEYDPHPRPYREAGSLYGISRERRLSYRAQEGHYGPAHDEVVYTHSRQGPYEQDYYPVSRQVRYLDDEPRRLVHPHGEEDGPRGPEPVDAKSADSFLDEIMPGPSASASAIPGATGPRPVTVLPDPDDGSRYTPPPPNPREEPEPRYSGAIPHTASSVASNGQRHERHSSGGRVPTPDSHRALRRPGPYRRRDRYNELPPSRYYRYLSVAREEPYTRGASMSRSQSKRYEEQRRRIDQQEAPRAKRDSDAPRSRDQSVEQGPPDEAPHQSRRPGQEYISVQDRYQPYMSPRYHYGSYAEEPRGPPPVYVDKYGQPIDEYEVIQVPRDSRASRGSYAPQGRYVDYEPEPVQYVPVAYDHPLPRHYEAAEPAGYVYYEDRARPSPRRPAAFDQPEAAAAAVAYEAPPPGGPDIKVESVPDAVAGL